MRKNITLSILAILCIGIAGITLFRVWSGDEDAWVCQGGVWISHGKPATQQPSSPCTADSANPSVSVIQKNAKQVTLSYQPMQCAETSWQQWSATSGAQIKKTVTDEEIIMSYYRDQGINVKNVSRVKTNAIVCQACDICPTDFIYRMEVPEGDVARLLLLGWNQKWEDSNK